MTDSTTTTATTTGTPATATFRTRLAGSGGKTGIVVPEEVVDQLGAGRRPAVHVELDGHVYRSTVAVMGGQCMIAVSAAVRQATGLQPGDPVTVVLTIATEARPVDVPADLAEALAGEPTVQAFFDGLSNSLQRFHVDNVVAAKTAETRQRRIEKSLQCFREGRKR